MAELGVLVIESTVRKKLHSGIVCDNAVVCLKSLFDAAVAFSDTAVVVINRYSSESWDRVTEKGDFYLTDEENALICRVKNAFDKWQVMMIWVKFKRVRMY